MKKLFLFVLTAVVLTATMLLCASAVNVSTADELVAIMSDSSRWNQDITLTADKHEWLVACVFPT